VLPFGARRYGYKIMRVLGVKTAKLTNSRGFAVELGSAITVITASRYGLPVSTTYCLVRAEFPFFFLGGGGALAAVCIICQSTCITAWRASIVDVPHCLPSSHGALLHTGAAAARDVASSIGRIPIFEVMHYIPGALG
jgi:Phosphate transporter family